MPRKLMTGADFNGQKATNLADPSNPADGVNLQFLNNFIRGLQWKEQVRAATTANISLTAPGASLDGVTLAANDRILLKDQTDPIQNGIYVWTASASTLTRALDADTTNELRPGTAVTVTAGTVNADKVFGIISDAVITIGTTAMTWGVIGGAGIAYTAGTGLALSGQQFAIDTAVVTRKVSQNLASSTTPTIVHNFGTLDVQIAVWLTSNGEDVDCDIFRTDANTVTFGFPTAPAAGSVRASVQG